VGGAAAYPETSEQLDADDPAHGHSRDARSTGARVANDERRGQAAAVARAGAGARPGIADGALKPFTAR
jgi:hypothetical protein